MNSRMSIFAAGFLALYGVYSITQGIKARKRSDVALGIVCLLGFGAAVVLMVMSGRNR